MPPSDDHSSKPFVVLGTGGNCVDILDTALACNERLGKEAYSCAGFLDDDPSLIGTLIQGYPVLGGLSLAIELPNLYFINGIGSTRNFWLRPRIINSARIPEDRFLTLVHPSAIVSPLASLEFGTVVLQGSVVGSCARIGRHVTILPLSVVSHDAEIGDYSIIAGNSCINGNVAVGRCCYIGSGVNIKEGVKLGENTLCGMGSNLLHDTRPAVVVTGNPASVLRALTLPPIE